jgi:DNA-binding CsgD family transcriptional regulator
LAHALDTWAGLDAEAGRWPQAYGHASEGLAAGSPEAAAHTLAAPASAPDSGCVGDLVEALVRSGSADEARGLLEQVAAREPPAVAARCSGLLAGDADFEPLLLHAIALHDEDDLFARARTRLCLGERLRRAGRRVDARVALRAAHADFERLAARPWARRAAAELRATGERLGRRAAREGDQLTPQELQVALQVADGKTNKEVGAALFLSPKTVDFHLRRVYRKLDVRSRGELIRHFASR